MIPSCDCSLRSGDFDAPKVSRVRIVKARKAYACCECGDTIPFGAMHECVRGLWGDDWESIRTCLACAAIRDHYCHMGHVYGQLAEHLEYCLGFDYREIPEDNNDRSNRHGT
jgi:hypothetical protein